MTPVLITLLWAAVCLPLSIPLCAWAAPRTTSFRHFVVSYLSIILPELLVLLVILGTSGK